MCSKQAEHNSAESCSAPLFYLGERTLFLFFISASLSPFISHLLPCMYHLMSASALCAPFSLLFALSPESFPPVPLSVPELYPMQFS